MTSVCPGCGLTLPGEALPPDRPLNATAACWLRYADVTGFEMTDAALVRDLHQLTVDAYLAQHAGPPTRPISVAYSLVGLHLALDLGVPGMRVRDAHTRMGRPQDWWPTFPRPASTGAITVDDVAHAGADRGSLEGHRRAVDAWARAVWAGWAHQHAEAARLARLTLADSGVLPQDPR